MNSPTKVGVMTIALLITLGVIGLAVGISERNIEALLGGTALTVIGVALAFNRNKEGMVETPLAQVKDLLVLDIDTVPGREIKEVLGIVQGNTVRAANVGRDFGALIQNVTGGEVTKYTKLTEQSRDEAYARMVNKAVALGAHAVINVRFTTNAVAQGASEMLAYGTAVKLK